jgi:hypothetical protein
MKTKQSGGAERTRKWLLWRQRRRQRRLKADQLK